MTPIAHTGVALMAWQKMSARKTGGMLFVYVLLSNLPDIDFLFKIFPNQGNISVHQYYTHNVLFAVLFAGIFMPLVKERRERVCLVLLSFSHLLLDLCNRDIVPPYGFRLFYPFSEQLYNLGFFPNLLRGGHELVSWWNVYVVCLEFTLFILPVLIYYRRQMRFQKL